MNKKLATKREIIQYTQHSTHF